MPPEPQTKRANVFIDGQNLFYGVKDAFGYTYPNYDPCRLAENICRALGCEPGKVHFYTGIPAVEDNPRWNAFWQGKLTDMDERSVIVYARPLKYRNAVFLLPDGSTVTEPVGQEKGIDVRIALDVVCQARENCYDVAVVFSQDQDLSEMAGEVKRISVAQDRWIKVVSAFPLSPSTPNARGINGTEWYPFDRAFYDACIDYQDYRPDFQAVSSTTENR